VPTTAASMPPPRGRVFISFASKDLAIAERVRTQLENGGIGCWIANRDIDAGVSYPGAITAAVTSSSAVLLLLTDASNASPHVLSEVELAFNARKPILPVRLSTTPLSPNLQYFLGTTQWFDTGREFDDADTARLKTRLEELIAGASTLPGPVAASRAIPRTLVAAATALVLLSAVAYVLLTRMNSRTNESARQTTSVSSNGNDIALPSTTPATTATTATIRRRVGARDGQTYVWIPPGRFTQGCSPGDSTCASDELPAHIVKIPNGFWMAQTEVTHALYAKQKTHDDANARGDGPVTRVTRADAKAYCAAVDARLPTESEWEYAARAGTTSARYDAVNDIGWYAANSNDGPHAVGQKTPNAFGLYDMLGNVYEWVLDRYYNAYDETSDDTTVEEPLAPNASGVARGGAWTSEAKELRASKRFELPPDAAEPMVGFRCVADR
jgi:formylglycine-generating enzyme required for sulfatase activity